MQNPSGFNSDSKQKTQLRRFKFSQHNHILSQKISFCGMRNPFVTSTLYQAGLYGRIAIEMLGLSTSQTQKVLWCKVHKQATLCSLILEEVVYMVPPF